MELREKKLNSNPSALLPILIFLVLYLGMGLIFEYGIGINMAFYDIPIVVTFMVACWWRAYRTKSSLLTRSWFWWAGA